VWEVQGLEGAFYRVEEEGEGAAEAVEASSGGGAPLVPRGSGGGRFGRGDGGAARGECADTLCRARWGGEGCGRPGSRRGWQREV
jgi:hypothetical protein